MSALTRRAAARCAGVPITLLIVRLFVCAHFGISSDHTDSATRFGAMIRVEPLNCSAIIVKVVAVLPNPGGRNSPKLKIVLAWDTMSFWYWCRLDLNNEGIDFFFTF